MDNYYARGLNAERLEEVYRTGFPRVRAYLRAEIDFVLKNIQDFESVLEVGAGYGRIMRELAPHAATVTGVDISEANVAYGREYLHGCFNCALLAMDAHELAFDVEFDVALCLQNGLSAIKGNPRNLAGRCLAAVKPGGMVLFSTYSPRFWDHRLAWFREQAAKGLVGELDEAATGNGCIVCRDGFVGTTFSEEELAEVGRFSGCRFAIKEVDGASLFLILEKPA